MDGTWKLGAMISQSLYLPRPLLTSTWPVKGISLVAVVLLHAAIAVLVGQARSSTPKLSIAPIQIITLDQAPQRDVGESLPPPILPANYTFDASQIVEPEFSVDSSGGQTITHAETTSATTTSTDASVVPKLVSSVEYVREPTLQYPSIARALKQRGTVMLRALIDTQGHAREVDVHQSSGYRLLDDAARRAVFNARFKPYSENGRPLLVYVFIPIEFGTA